MYCVPPPPPHTPFLCIFSVCVWTLCVCVCGHCVCVCVCGHCVCVCVVFQPLNNSFYLKTFFISLLKNYIFLDVNYPHLRQYAKESKNFFRATFTYYPNIFAVGKFRFQRSHTQYLFQGLVVFEPTFFCFFL